MIEIRSARFPQDLEPVRAIFREYADSLGVDLCFQGFEAELAGLPGKYAEPQGRLLLAEDDGQIIGCVAMRPLDGPVCEMKRLYVRPAGRGRRLGRRLATAICRAAKQAGYERMRLDTLASMQAAQRMYRSLGFEPIAPYVFNPIEGAMYMELDLGMRDFA
jgi:ribosomal protein S18 acetylase RimI-like enzyme